MPFPFTLGHRVVVVLVVIVLFFSIAICVLDSYGYRLLCWFCVLWRMFMCKGKLAKLKKRTSTVSSYSACIRHQKTLNFARQSFFHWSKHHKAYFWRKLSLSYCNTDLFIYFWTVNNFTTSLAEVVSMIMQKLLNEFWQNYVEGM